MPDPTIPIESQPQIISRTGAKALGLKRYFTGKACKHRHVSERYTSTYICLGCANLHEVGRDHDKKKKARRAWQHSPTGKAWRERQKTQTTRNKINEKVKTQRKRDPRPFMLKAAAKRAREQGLEFDLTKDDISIPAVCPVLGIPLFVRSKKGPGNNSPSLDRFKNEIGYKKHNVNVISHRANRIKTDASVEELSKVLAYMMKGASIHEYQ